jgi:hypothetical protein
MFQAAPACRLGASGGLRDRIAAENCLMRQIMNAAHVVMKLSLFHSPRDSGKNRPH